MNFRPKVYLAAPLFNPQERLRNERLAASLELRGFGVYLPQRDAGVSYDAIASGLPKDKVRSDIFEGDLKAIRECDLLVGVLDGRVPDEGTCIEIGIAFALGKACYGLKTDDRAFDKHGDNNIMLDGCLEGRLCRSEQELVARLGLCLAPES